MALVKIILIFVCSVIATIWLPWYMFIPVCFLIGLLLSNYEGNNFLAGCIGVGLFWLLYTLVLDIKNNHQLSSAIAAMFSEKLGTDISSTLLIVVTALIGTLLGGLSCFSGALFSADEYKKKSNKSRSLTSRKRYKLNL